MLAKRLALATGLLLALVVSQLPEFVQQYRQRLGGTIDELKRTVAQFDVETRAQQVTREAGLARLRSNADPLAQARGIDLQSDIDREARLEAQERAFTDAGPIGRYWAFAERFDPELAGLTYRIFEPAVPLTQAGFIAAVVGFLAGYGGARLLALPFRRRQPAMVAA